MVVDDGGHGGDDTDKPERYFPLDETPEHEHESADEQCAAGGFADTAADISIKEVVEQSVGRSDLSDGESERGRAAEHIDTDHFSRVWNRPSGHDLWEADEQPNARNECGIKGVIAEAAKDLFAETNRQKRSDEANPPRDACGKIHAEQQARQNRATVFPGVGVLTGDFSPEPFNANTKENTKNEHTKCAKPEIINPSGARRHQRKDDPTHNLWNRFRAANMRGV